jgi:hypothetical protein
MVTKMQNPKVRRLVTYIANFMGKDGHFESKCFKKMEDLEASMKKHNINIDSSSSNSSSHGYELFSSGLSFNAISTYSFYEWFIDYGGS